MTKEEEATNRNNMRTLYTTTKKIREIMRPGKINQLPVKLLIARQEEAF